MTASSSSATPTASIILIGEEIIDGRIHDRNGAFLSALLTAHGVSVRGFIACGDRLPEIVSALEYAYNQSEIVLTSGGLGPTTDDLTRDAIGAYFNRSLSLREEELFRLKAWFRKRGRTFIEANREQARFPEGSLSIANPIGTANGILIENGSKLLFSLPGVPRELEVMATEGVMPFLQKRYRTLRPRAERTIRTFGIPESLAQQRIALVERPPAIEISYRPSFPELHITLFSQEESEELERFHRSLITAVDEAVVVSESSLIDLPTRVHELLSESGKTISVAESCTGGLLGSYLTRFPGSSSYFLGGALTYSNEMKQKMLGVELALLQEHGAVSPQVARAMATGIVEATGSDLGISITGIAGPGGATSGKPVGLFYIGIGSSIESWAVRGFFSGSRDFVRRFATFMALEQIRRFLLGAPLTKDMDIPSQ